MKLTKYKMILLFALFFFLSIGIAAAADDKISNDANPTHLTGQSVGVDSSIGNTTPIIKTPTSIVTKKSVTAKQYKKVKLAATLKTKDGKAIKKSQVTFKFNGKTYKTTTNSYGKATVSVKMPKAKYLKTVKKTKGKIMTQTKVYRTSKKCTVSFAGNNEYEASKKTFNVVSTNSIAKKYRIISKKTYAMNIKIRNGMTYHNIANYVALLYKHKKGKVTFLETTAAKKSGKSIGFKITHHIKHGGKWKWTKWTPVAKGKTNTFSFDGTYRCDRQIVKIEEIKYKRIK